MTTSTRYFTHFYKPNTSPQHSPTEPSPQSSQPASPQALYSHPQCSSSPAHC
ncbi:hypothetical protein AOQ84DRAFT_70437 [Glonium stellatum]|uniref:Uncharacterized protein n=1 Tax=Glonium stellatum TaxID=574774 RepID=A0A8E2EYR0_9PEZI|nr:hypothetical protein AOQ84DRAFT_70437 [Glonium stellatum]